MRELQLARAPADSDQVELEVGQPFQQRVHQRTLREALQSAGSIVVWQDEMGRAMRAGHLFETGRHVRRLQSDHLRAEVDRVGDRLPQVADAIEPLSLRLGHLDDHGAERGSQDAREQRDATDGATGRGPAVDQDENAFGDERPLLPADGLFRAALRPAGRQAAGRAHGAP